MPIFGVWLLLAMGAASAPILTVNELELQAQKSGTVPVGFRSDTSVAAMQMDVLFDAAAYTATSATAGTLPESYRVDSYLAEPGRLRVVVGAPSNGAITDATAFNVPLTAASNFSAAYPVVLTNFIFSTSDSLPVTGKLAPRVRLLNLTSGGSVNAKGGLQLSVEAGATDGSVARVEYFSENQKIGQNTVAPFGMVWTPSGPGSYTLQAVAYDSNGIQTASRSIPIVVFFNSAPTVRAITLGTTVNQPVSIPVAKLLSFARDADGDAMSITALSPASSQGAAVALNGGLMSYSPLPGFTGTDLFSYTVSDGRESAMGTVTITVRPADGLSLNMVSFTRTAEGFLLKFAGIPGNSYIIQFRNTLDVSDPWVPLNPPGPIQAGPNGLFQYEDKPFPIPPTRFYRAAESPQ